MGYVGNSPALKYTSFAVQHFTTSATTSYSLDHAVTNENDIRLVINNVVQQPGSGKAYTASDTTLTLSSATAGTDVMYCVFLGKAVQTVVPGQGSVGTSQLTTDAVTTAKITDGNVTAAKFNADVISGQTELATTPADTDEFLLSDAGVLKRIDYSHIKSTSLFTQVATGSASSAASLEITSAFSATYTNYMIVLTNWSVGSDATFQFRTGQSDGTYTSGFCFEQRTHVYDDDQNVTSGNNAADITLFNTQRAGAGCYIDGILYVWRPMSAVDTNRGYTWHTHGIRNNSGTAYGYCIGGGASAEANAHTRIKFTPSTGTFTGTATVYGMTNPS